MALILNEHILDSIQICKYSGNLHVGTGLTCYNKTICNIGQV